MVGASPVTQEDVLAVEEPLEIRVGGRSLAVTMRTPRNDYDLGRRLPHNLSGEVLCGASSVSRGAVR